MEEISFYYANPNSLLSKVLVTIYKKVWEENEAEDWDGPWNVASQNIYEELEVTRFEDFGSPSEQMDEMIAQSSKSELTVIKISTSMDDEYIVFAGNPDEVLKRIYELAPDDLRLRVLVE